MDVARFGERIVERAAARALVLEPLVPAADAEVVLRIVRPEPAAHRTPLRHRRRHRVPRSQLSGSTARPWGRISKCRCGRRSGSEMPTVPITSPFRIDTPVRTPTPASDTYTEQSPAPRWTITVRPYVPSWPTLTRMT